MFVLVQNGLAHQIWATRPELPPGLVVVETSEPVEIGWAWDDGHFLPVEPISSDLENVKVAAIAAIDQKAERARAKFVTQGSAQAMVYLCKEAEATRFQETYNPVPTDYPLLLAEVGITGDDLASVAARVLALASTWRLAAASIETTRLSAKKAIQEAETIAVVDAIFAAAKFQEA